MAAARRIAVEGDCAVMVAAHTRKPSQAASGGFAGDADTMRGAGAQLNVMRLVHTLYGMDAKDHKKWGVLEADRHRYIRLDTGKTNLSLAAGKPKWFRRVSVALGDHNGEQIGVLEPAYLVEKRIEVDLAHVVANYRRAGLVRLQWYSTAEIEARMTVAERGVLGDVKNRSRRVVDACKAHGANAEFW